METSPTGRRVKTPNDFICDYGMGQKKLAEVIAQKNEPKPDFITMDFALIEARAAAWLEGANHE